MSGDADTLAHVEETDQAIVRLLAREGTSYTDLTGAPGLSTSAVHQRVRRLEERGVINGYVAVIDSEAVLGRIRAAANVSTPYEARPPGV